MADHVVSLTDTQEAALTVATDRFNAANDSTLTASEFFALKATEQINLLIRVTRERDRNALIEDYDKLTTTDQQAVRQSIKDKLPSGVR
jgi:hypothetical protein